MNKISENQRENCKSTNTIDVSDLWFIVNVHKRFRVQILLYEVVSTIALRKLKS